MSALVDLICTPGTRIEPEVLEDVFRAGDVLERIRRSDRPKVVRLQRPACGPLIVKVWYPKAGLSTDTLRRYATRFRTHARRLRRKNVVAPDVLGWGTIAGSRICFVCYPEVPGRTLREWIPNVDLEAAGAFVAHLHRLGIDFRSLHMGNLVWSDAGGYGLIDVTDCDFPWFMSRSRRLRRLRSFCGHRMERPFLLVDDNWRRFVGAYCAAACMEAEWMLERVARHLGGSAS